jgi:hypothetical protein
MVEPDGNQRITMAILGNDIRHVIELLEEMGKSAADREVRLRYLEGTRIPAIENRATLLEERQGILAKIQIAYTTVVAAVVAFLSK